MLLVLIMIQIVISVIWCLIETPKVVIEWANPNSMDPGCEKCNVDEIARFSSQAYNFILITFTTYFAIRTRELSCGSKWIFRAMISNWIIGFIFAAVHYTNLNNYAVARVALCFTTSLSAYLYLFLYFGPKVYIILFKIRWRDINNFFNLNMMGYRRGDSLHSHLSHIIIAVEFSFKLD